jgi:hypothetical protein
MNGQGRTSTRCGSATMGSKVAVEGSREGGGERLGG